MKNSKRIFILSVIIVFMLVLSTIFGATITHFAPEYGVTTTNVNFRSMPTSDYSSFIRTLSPNTKLKIMGSLDDYYIVQLETNEVGLIYKEYAKITGDEILSKTYTDYAPFYGIIKGDNTIVRGGPSTSFTALTKLNQGDKVYVIGAIDNFLLVITQDNLVGMIREDLVEYNSENNDENTENITDTQDNESTDITSNVYYILEKINAIRAQNGISALVLDDLITSTAQVKAEDMVTNSYFAHTSPTYGTPFEMMQNAGITYKTAGENIAGNSSIDTAIENFLTSSEHSKNLLSNSYNYIGIGIEESETYGYIIVLMFVGRY